MTKGPTIEQKLAAMDRANVTAAEIILAQPERHRGLELEWARMVIGASARTQPTLIPLPSSNPATN